ncbi:MAG: hypothetical protein ACLVBT_09830 [Roseburia hominis]
MGRLIDADNLQFNGRNYNKSQMKAILDFIDSQPTAYDPDKVVEQLEEVSYERLENNGMGGELVVNLDDAVEIVKGGGVDAKTDS